MAEGCVAGEGELLFCSADGQAARESSKAHLSYELLGSFTLPGHFVSDPPRGRVMVS